MSRVLIIADRELDWERTKDLRALSQSFAAYLGETVEFAWARPQLLALAREAVEPMPGDDPVETLQPIRVMTEGMAAADLQEDEDGRPDWSAMWESSANSPSSAAPRIEGTTAASALSGKFPHLGRTGSTPSPRSGGASS